MKIIKKLFPVSAIAIFICGICGCGLFKTGIKINQYITYEYDGVDGYTDLITDIDTESLINDFSEKIGQDKQKEFSELVSSLQVTATKGKNLSNGDEISLSVSYDDTYIDYLNIRFKQNNLKITIDGLKEGELLDVFEDVKVEVTGTAPIATAQVVNESDNEFIKNLEFVLDKTENIERGDILNVTCSVDDEAAYALGYVVLEKEKSYCADYIDSYMFDEALMDRDVLSEVVNEAQDTVISSTEDTHSRMLYKITENTNYLFQYNKEWVENIEVKEIKLLKMQDLASYSADLPVNKLYIILYAYVTNADYGSDGYFCFEYDNVVLKADNTLQINHENPELRFLCNDDYDELMEQVYSLNQIEYTEENIEIELQ